MSSSIRRRPTRSLVPRMRNPPFRPPSVMSVSRLIWSAARSTRACTPGTRPTVAVLASEPVKAPAVERVHDRARARGRVEHTAQVDGARLAAARSVEESVRDHEAKLASGHAREAAHDVLQRVQGHVRIAEGLVQELDGLALDFPLRHLLHRVARDAGGPGGGARRRLSRRAPPPPPLAGCSRRGASPAPSSRSRSRAGGRCDRP